MRRHEELMPPGLAETRPGLAGVVRSVLRRLTADELKRILEELGPQLPLDQLWRETGCPRHFGFGVGASDLVAEPSQLGASTDAPRLSDACYPLVTVGRRGRRNLAIALAFAAEAEGTPVSLRVPRELVRTAGLRFSPSRRGLFAAARFVARARGRPVQPNDLVDTLAVVLTPSLREGLAAVGARAKVLDARLVELLEELGTFAVARLREVVIVPPELLALPDDWNLHDVRTTSDMPLVPEHALLPDLDAAWIVSRYLWIAGADGIPVPPRIAPKVRIPTARAVLRRYAGQGWVGVFAGALRASGWEPSIVEVDGCSAAELVRRGLHDVRPEEPRPPRDTAGLIHTKDPAEQARAEYAEIRDALAARIIGRGDIDRIALIALAHRRGVGDRLLITGPSGGGKSFIARAIAEVVGAHVFLQDATGLVETGYRGLSVPELIDAMYRSAGADREALETSVLVLDELEKVRIGPGVDDGVSRDKRWGMQACVLTLLQGGVPIVAGDGSLVVDTRRMLIVCTGAFSDSQWADERVPTTDDLVQYGLIRELAERLRTRIFLPPRSIPELAAVMRLSDESVEAIVGPLAREMGIELQVLPSAYVMVARMIAEERAGMGLRTGTQVLVTAAQRALLRALQREDGSPVALVTPDDIDRLPRARR